MRYLVLFVCTFILGINSLYAQKREHLRVMPKAHSLNFSPLKHNRMDSIRYARPQIRYVHVHHQNQHIKDPVVRYALSNLKRDRIKYYELYKAINTLSSYAENEHIKYMLDYVRNYFETVQAKEEAIKEIKQRIEKDSIEFCQTHSEDTIRSDRFLNQDLKALLSFMDRDVNYQWLKERSRDSVQITLLSASNKPKNLWLNTGKTQYYRFMTENFIGDTIGTWVKVMPQGKQLKFFLDENVYQYKKYSNPKEIKEECVLEASDSIYFVLADMHVGKLKQRYWLYYTDVTLSFGQGFISSNWASGGENSLSILSDLKYFATYKKNNTTWENSIRYRLGALKSGSEDLSKNEDKLELQSKLGIKAFKHWNYATQFDMNTVLFKSKNNPAKEVVAAFLTPGNFTLSLGLDYKPTKNISLYLSPIAGQWVYMRDTNLVNPSRYGLEKGKKFKSDAGAKIELKNKHEYFNFLQIDNHLIVFSSYYEQPEKLTVDWRLTLNFKINYFMQTSIYANCVYNQNDSKKIQMKETLNLGVYFRF